MEGRKFDLEAEDVRLEGGKRLQGSVSTGEGQEYREDVFLWVLIIACILLPSLPILLPFAS